MLEVVCNAGITNKIEKKQEENTDSINLKSSQNNLRVASLEVSAAKESYFLQR